MFLTDVSASNPTWVSGQSRHRIC